MTDLLVRLFTNVFGSQAIVKFLMTDQYITIMSTPSMLPFNERAVKKEWKPWREHLQTSILLLTFLSKIGNFKGLTIFLIKLTYEFKNNEPATTVNKRGCVSITTWCTYASVRLTIFLVINETRNVEQCSFIRIS
jgi:hypothetical protein